LDWLLKVAKMFKLSIRTIIAAIDMMERYVSNYPIKLKKSLLFACSFISISSKMLEIYPPQMGDLVFVSDNAFTIQNLKETELIVVQRMNGILISCDIDKYVHLLQSINKVLKLSNIIKIQDIIAETYKLIESQGLYSGLLSYNEIIKYTNQIYNLYT
jgi:hypothetical protein